MPIAPWLRQHLQDTGRWNGDHIATTAKLATHTCGQPVLTGLDSDLCAWPATVDPLPLTPTGEMLALLGGRTTYDYWTNARQLHRRIDVAIRGRPATDTGSTRVLATHICNTPPLPHYPAPAITKTEETTDVPPF
jgi:hypothetical protein